MVTDMLFVLSVASAFKQAISIWSTSALIFGCYSFCKAVDRKGGRERGKGMAIRWDSPPPPFIVAVFGSAVN